QETSMQSNPTQHTELMPQHHGLYYGGQWHDALSGKTFDVHNPATGELLASIADGGPQDAQAAVAHATAGVEAWRRLRPIEPATRMNALAALVREHADELAMLDALDGGNP